MPHTKSAKKALRQATKRRLRNRVTKKGIKVAIKEFDAATPEARKAAFEQACKKLDKAAAKKVIHPNAAARKKSQLAKALNKA